MKFSIISHQCYYWWLFAIPFCKSEGNIIAQISSFHSIKAIISIPSFAVAYCLFRERSREQLGSMHLISISLKTGREGEDSAPKARPGASPPQRTDRPVLLSDRTEAEHSAPAPKASPVAPLWYWLWGVEVTPVTSAWESLSLSSRGCPGIKSLFKGRLPLWQPTPGAVTQ